MSEAKFALLVFGRDDNLGLMFVGGEIKEAGYQFRYFDSESPDFINQVISWMPDYICFSPLCIDYDLSISVARKIRKKHPSVISVFGGPHIMGIAADEEELNRFAENDAVDIIVIGPVRRSIDRILKAQKKEIIRTIPTTPDDIAFPARQEFYEQIPRLASRYMKNIVSMLGCPFDCSYCSNHLKKSMFGSKIFEQYFLGRRSISEMIKEGKVLLNFNTIEASWEDDDPLFGSDIEDWLIEFVDAWKTEVGIPIRFQASPKSILKSSEKILLKLREISCWCIMGIQCIRKESLELFNRNWQSEKEAKEAHDRLRSYGFFVLMQSIIGLPVEDPVEDAIQTVLGLKRIGAGSMATAFPLLLLPGSRLYKECKAKGVPINEDAYHVLHTGLPSIRFSDDVTRKITNISKCIKIFVKYDMDENWIRALIEIENLGEETRRRLAECGFSDCVERRWAGDEKNQKVIFNSIRNTYLKY